MCFYLTVEIPEGNYKLRSSASETVFFHRKMIHELQPGKVAVLLASLTVHRNCGYYERSGISMACAYFGSVVPSSGAPTWINSEDAV